MCVYMCAYVQLPIYFFLPSSIQSLGNVDFLPNFIFSHTTEWDQRFFIDPNSGIKIFPRHYDMYSLIFSIFMDVLVLALLLFFSQLQKIFPLLLPMLKYWPKFSIFAWLVTWFYSADDRGVDGVFDFFLGGFLWQFNINVIPPLTSLSAVNNQSNTTHPISHFSWSYNFFFISFEIVCTSS